MHMPKPRKQLAIAFARNFAAGLIQNAEVHWQQGSGLSEEELDLADQELAIIAKKIEASIPKKYHETFQDS